MAELVTSAAGFSLPFGARLRSTSKEVSDEHNVKL